MSFFNTAAKRAAKTKATATRETLRKQLKDDIADTERRIADIDRAVDPRGYGYQLHRSEQLHRRAQLADQLAYDKRELRDL